MRQKSWSADDQIVRGVQQNSAECNVAYVLKDIS